jgi:hypothetical protein
MGEDGGTASAGKQQPTPPARMELYLALVVDPSSLPTMKVSNTR